MRILIFSMVFCFVCLTGCASRSGEASWYGPGFAGKPTASGERFDPYQLTAAHKDLPFGTLVRVTNKKNGKSVVVRINDRFPGTKGRKIDLSKAAFARIADTDEGVIDVKIKVLD
ncbi:MAG: septal ring lytic transglycosylase RlpA family protein [Sumerlaeia bacterium]